MSYKSFLALFVLVLIVVTGIQFKRMIIDNDYVIYANTSCNPSIESCFVYNCDESEESCDKTPYKKIEKMAYNAKDCDLSKPECMDLKCEANETGCLITTCSEEILEEWEMCFLNEPILDLESDLEIGDSQ